MKKFLSLILLGTIVVTLSVTEFDVPQTKAANVGDVVINEVAWMGSLDATNDEWIELYNTTTSDIDLTSWIIYDDGTPSTVFTGGIIPAQGYFLLESTEDAVSSITADYVEALSLANTGDTLVLRDELGQVIDTVNSSGGAWFAGSNTSKKTMERIDPAVSGDISTNWQDNYYGLGDIASAGSLIEGTPKADNSIDGGSPAAEVRLTPSTTNPNNGDTLTVQTDIINATELFSYGFDITYDPTVLDFQSAAVGDFLGETSTVNTSFQSGLDDNTEGKVVIGEARTIDPKVGLDGSGDLFTLSFLVIGSNGSSTNIDFSGQNFISTPTAQSTANYTNTSITVGAGGTVDPVEGLTTTEGTNRYEIILNWTAGASGADSYRILRQDVTGTYVEIGTTTNLTFTDGDGVSNGGYIVPNLTYNYQVIAVLGGSESMPVDVSGVDTRGLKGDNTRNDRTDGLDLDNLAKHWAETTASANFDPLVDTSYEGEIEGNDLIDIGATWALSYN